MSSEAALPLSSFVSLVRGTTYKGELVGQPGPLLLGLASIQPDGGFRRGSFKTYGGASPSKITLGPGDVYVSLKDVTQSGDLLGSVARVPSNIPAGRLTQDTVKLQFDGKPISQEYVYWLLRTPEYRAYCRSHATGTTTLGLARDDFLDFPVAVPGEQTLSLVELLEALDDRITLLRETNATLESIAQALFKSWFVDFDPVRAKMEGRTPEGMDDATAALFPDALEETELGPVPKGWRYSTIGESFILTMGQSPPGDTYNEAGDGLPFYQGRTDFGFRFPSQRVFCTAPTRLAEPGDTLVSVRAPVGDVNMALEKCCVGRGVAAVRHPNGCRSFAFYATRGLRSRFDLFDSEGTVFGSINKKDFQALPVIEPSGDVLVAFDEIAAPIDRRIVGNEEQIRTLATLRDTLLPRLISGQLRVPEASEATLA